MDDLSRELKITHLRIESLKANRNLFAVLFTVESAVLAIIVDRFNTMLAEFGLTIILLSITLILMLFGLFALTDSIHAYSKYIEYRYMWRRDVYGEAYKNVTSEEKATDSLKNALEADDVSYQYQKYAFLSLLWSFASFIVVQKLLPFWAGLVLFLVVGILFTFLTLKTYKETHRRKWRKTPKKYFKRTVLFPC